MQKNKPKEIIDDILCLNNRLVRLTNQKIFAQHKLTLSLYIPLRMIAYNIHTIEGMKAHYSETTASLGQKIKKLEKLALVKRILDPEDKRRWNFIISEKGTAVLQDIEPQFAQLCRDMFAHFTQVEMTHLATALEKLEKNIKK